MSFRFKKFRVYEEAKKFAKFCRESIERNLRKKDRELASQIDRAVNSIVLNIAEGSADNSDVEFSRVLGIAIRSVYEVVAAFDLALLYGIIGPEQNDHIETQGDELVRQLSAFRNSLKSS